MTFQKTLKAFNPPPHAPIAAIPQDEFAIERWSDLTLAVQKQEFEQTLKALLKQMHRKYTATGKAAPASLVAAVNMLERRQTQLNQTDETTDAVDQEHEHFADIAAGAVAADLVPLTMLQHTASSAAETAMAPIADAPPASITGVCRQHGNPPMCKWGCHDDYSWTREQNMRYEDNRPWGTQPRDFPGCVTERSCQDYNQ